MRFMDKVERLLRPYAVSNLTYWLVMAQICGFVGVMLNPNAYQRIHLDPQKILSGEVWRLITCIVAVPPIGTGMGLLFYALFLYIFWMMGSVMEAHWGHVRYNIYIGIAFLCVLAIAFITGAPQFHVAANIEYTVMLAFCYAYADFTFMIWFILPVKAKYIGLIAWIGIVIRTAYGDWTALASVTNFFVFFGRAIVARIRYGRKKMQAHTQAVRDRNKAFHTCTICGVTDKSDPSMEFRYCSKCTDERCYCMDHILNHEHV